MARLYHWIYTWMILSLFMSSLPALADEVVPKESLPTSTAVSVQLKWFHQFQFAGFYAALEQGYFSQAGLNVTLIEGGPGIDPVDSVIDGAADFGIGNSTLLVDFNNGRPVVAVAAIFQHSPFVILARRDKDLRSLSDLEGRKLMGETRHAELLAYLALAGVQIDKIQFVPHTGKVKSLIEQKPGGVDATTAYISTGPYLATRENIPHHIFSPRDIDINFYGDTLFTSRDFSQRHPDLVIAIREALIKGWQYALKYPDEIVSLILDKYQPNKNRLALGFESQVVTQLLANDVVDIGFMSRNRWRHIGDTFAKSGVIKESYGLDGFLFETKETLPTWVYMILLAAFLVIFLVAGTTLYILRINHRLRRSLVQINEQKDIIEHQSTHDTLTGLPMLRLARDRWNKAIGIAKRERSKAAILFIDLDDFKAVNDTFGHDAGDYVLKSVAQRISESIREVDTAARVGGDEFIVILNGINASKDASTVTEKIKSLIPEPIIYNDIVINISASIGIAIYPEHASNAGDLLKYADMAMYSLKKAGKVAS